MNKKDPAEESFTQKLDISMVSTVMFRNLLDVTAGTDLVLAAVGKSGIGKTAIPRQVAAERNAPYVCFDGPTTSIEDFFMPTSAQDTRVYYDKRRPRKLQRIVEYVKKLREENGGEFPAGRHPILAVEELNRTGSKHVTRAFFTLLNERIIGDLALDPAIQLVVTLNPSGGGMVVNEFERDPAMRRRLKWLGVTASYGDFIRFAKKSDFHEKVIAHLEAQPQHFYDDAASLAGKVFACPASWEDVSKMCYCLDASSCSLTGSEARAAFAGTIGLTATEAFVEFIQDESIVITPSEVLQHYTKGSTVRKRFKKLVEDSRLDRVSTLCEAVAIKIYENVTRRPQLLEKQLGLFMADMPEEVMLAFVRELTEQSKTTTGGHQFLQALNARMADKNGSFQTAVERLQKAQQKGKEEAEKNDL